MRGSGRVASLFTVFTAALAAAMLFGGVSTASAATVRPRSATVTAGTVSITRTHDNVVINSEQVDQVTATAVTPAWGPDGVNLAYQWYANGKAIPGAVTRQFVSSNPGYIYANLTLKVTGSVTGLTSASVTSMPAKTSSGVVCTVVGYDTADTSLTGTAKSDVICGLGGDDIILMDKGNDVIDGGSGEDQISYLGLVSKPTTVNLVTNKATNALYGTETLLSIEDATTGDSNDTLVGNSFANQLIGRGGNDVITGGDGDDRLLGGDGNDTLTGGTGSDRLIGLAGNDTVNGGGVGVTDDAQNFCDRADSYLDTATNCTIVASMPHISDITLSRSSLRPQSTVTFTANVSDDLKNIVNVQVKVEPASGATPLVAAGFWDATAAYAGSSLEGSDGPISMDVVSDALPDALFSGTAYLGIEITSTDGRTAQYQGQADGTYIPTFEDDVQPAISIGTASVTLLAADKTAPVLDHVTASETAVDTTTEAQTIQLDIAAHDDVNTSSELTYSCAIFNLDNDTWSASVDTPTQVVASSGNECAVQIPEGSPGGHYGLWVEVSDTSQNTSFAEASSVTTYKRGVSENPIAYHFDDVEHPISEIGDLVIQETSSRTSVGADLSGLRFSATSVSPLTASKTVTLTGTVTTDGLYVPKLSCTLVGYRVTGSPNQGSGSTFTSALADGHVNFRMSFVIPKLAPKGRYNLQCQVADSKGLTTTFSMKSNGQWQVLNRQSSAVTTDASVGFITVQ